MIKKGYSLLEILLTMCLISSLLLLSINKTQELDLSAYYYLNDYLLSQSDAICDKVDVSYKNGISFNSMGHVNQARTIDLNKHSIIVHLGTGYATLN